MEGEGQGGRMLSEPLSVVPRDPNHVPNIMLVSLSATDTMFSHLPNSSARQVSHLRYWHAFAHLWGTSCDVSAVGLHRNIQLHSMPLRLPKSHISLCVL